MDSNKPRVSDSEFEILQVLWDEGPGKVRDVLCILRDRRHNWTYATVLTLLRRLEVKGYVRADTSEFAHTFRASISRDKMLGQRLRSLANRYCGGATAPMILALVKGRKPSPEEIRQVRRVLDELEKEEDRARGPKGSPRSKKGT